MNIVTYNYIYDILGSCWLAGYLGSFFKYFFKKFLDATKFFSKREQGLDIKRKKIQTGGLLNKVINIVDNKIYNKKRKMTWVLDISQNDLFVFSTIVWRLAINLRKAFVYFSIMFRFLIFLFCKMILPKYFTYTKKCRYFHLARFLFDHSSLILVVVIGESATWPRFSEGHRFFHFVLGLFLSLLSINQSFRSLPWELKQYYFLLLATCYMVLGT